MFENITNKTIKIFFEALMLITLLSIVASEYKNQVLLTRASDFMPIIIGILFYLFLFQIFKKSSGAKCKSYLLICTISLFFFIFLLIITYNYYFITGWDCGAVVGAAETIAKGESFDYYLSYFSRCSNNITLTYIYSYIIKLAFALEFYNGYFACIAFQCFLFALTGLLVFIIANMLSDLRVAIISYVSFVLLVGLSPWVICPYSDATGLIFPILFLYIFLLAQKIAKPIVTNISAFAIGTLSVLAFKIKPQLIIIVIAICILKLTKFVTSSNRRAYYVSAISFLLGLFTSFIAITFVTNSFEISLDTEKDYGMWYYLCIGSNVESIGVCNIEDQTFALSFEGKKERDNALKKLFLERLHNNSFKGSLKLMLRKNRLNYSNGLFGWWCEDNGNFYKQNSPIAESKFSAFLKQIYYPSGAKYFFYSNTIQGIWMATLLFCLLNLFAKRKPNPETLLLMLSIIGLSLFEMIFESRSRYLFTYVPIYVILASSLELQSKVGYRCLNLKLFADSRFFHRSFSKHVRI